MSSLLLPRSGVLWISTMDVDDNQVRIGAPVPQTLHLYLPDSHFTDLSQHYNLPRSPAQSIRYAADVDDDLIRQLGMAILQELHNESAAGRMLVESAAITLAARLAQTHGDCWSIRPFGSRHRMDDQRVRRVLDYIAAYQERDITVAELAQVACVSVYHFSRMFRAAVGMTPQRYVARLQMQRAKGMLAEGRLCLAQIAVATHFSSQAAFTRAFRRETGMSPGEYRLRSR